MARFHRILDVRPDTLDFRDRMFEPTLVEVPVRISLESYLAWKVPILDQGTEGACTGFGLATVAHYLLRRRRVEPDRVPVSPRMFYEMARRYDEWPGEDYSGSSARGAMKGWYKHGVCSSELWPYRPGAGEVLTGARAADATKRPLGAYLRVNHRDLVAMHSALAEVGVVYASAHVHEGWQKVGEDGIVPWDAGRRVIGGHAFAIVAFDERGFWFQNSWGPAWGRHGFGLISYDDWVLHASDVWVARLGAPVVLRSARASAAEYPIASGSSRSNVYADLRPHVISLESDGALRQSGPFGTSAEGLSEILLEDFPRITRDWPEPKRLMLYANGGLVSEDAAIRQLADYRVALLDARVYPITFVWRTDFSTIIGDLLRDAVQRRRPAGSSDGSKDFMLDRLDDALEGTARRLGARTEWSGLKADALAATRSPHGGGRLAMRAIAQLAASQDIELHVVAHSAGSILMAPLVQFLSAGGTGRPAMSIATCTLWAPACTIDLFNEMYGPAIAGGAIERFALFTLTDEAERADSCAGTYGKSLLYLVSNALEAAARIPGFRDGVPLAGMETFVRKELTDLFRTKRAEWILAPNDAPAGRPDASRARTHGAFDEDPVTWRATLARILRSKGSVARAAAPGFPLPDTPSAGARQSASPSVGAWRTGRPRSLPSG